MSEMTPGPPEPTGPIDGRVVRMLRESGGRVAFNGLRRSLRVHPESLTRALRRLERGGEIERGDDGYALASTPRRPLRPPELRTISSIELPRGVLGEGLLGRLTGRWLGTLRWVGVFDRDERPCLTWSGPDGIAHLFLSADGDRLSVRTDAAEPSAAMERAALELLRRVLLEAERTPADGGPLVELREPAPIGWAAPN